MMRYEGAVSDTDILINFASIDKLEILEHLFKKIIIPWYVYEIELKRNAGKKYSKIVRAIKKEESIFEIKNRMEDKAINLLSKDIIAEKKILIGQKMINRRGCVHYVNTMYKEVVGSVKDKT